MVDDFNNNPKPSDELRMAVFNLNHQEYLDELEGLNVHEIVPKISNDWGDDLHKFISALRCSHDKWGDLKRD